MSLKIKSLSPLQKAIIAKAIGGYGIIDTDNLSTEIERFAGMFDGLLFFKRKSLTEKQINYIDGFLACLYANFDHQKALKINCACWDFRSQANVLKKAKVL